MIRKIRTWTEESDRAVSPVIGVILMVAITVILAAVIGSFVLGIGGDVEQTPQVRLSVAASGDSVDISHDGGDALTGSDLRIIVNNATASNTTEITRNNSVPDLSVGEKVEITYASEDPNPDSIRVRVIHKPSDSLIVDTESTV